MKTVSTDLSTYLSTEKNITSCDLYELVLSSGNHYYYADTDVDITYNGIVYKHNALILKRQQIKTNSSITVDSMTITVYTDQGDEFEDKFFLQAAHNGSLDRAKLYLKRCFFNGTSVVGAISLFGGNVEVKSAGGIKIQLTVKARTQGLNIDFPIRKFYAQGTYATNSSGKIIGAGKSEDTCLIAPFIPTQEALL